MKIYIAIALTILTFISFAQESINCQEIRKKTPHFISYQEGKSEGLIEKDIQVIKACLELDTVDQIILLSPGPLGTLIVGLMQEKENITYGDVFYYLEEVKDNEQYSKTRLGIEFMIKYENKIVDPADSNKVRWYFEQMGGAEFDLDDLIDFAYSENNSELTYKEAFSLFMQSKEPKPSKRNEEADSFQSIFDHFKEMESLEMVMKNSSSGKPKLLYFTGWACVNGRKMEEALFLNPGVNELFGAYDCYMGYADDKSAATEQQKLDFSDVEIKTKGQFISELEKTLFPEEFQPVILIVDQDFKLVDSFAYSQDVEALIRFLTDHKTGD